MRGAMATGLSVDPEQLARKRATWCGNVPVSSFHRAASLINNDAASVALELAFELDDAGLCLVTGSATVNARIRCHRCLELIDHAVEAVIEMRVLRSEAQAQGLTPDYDTVVLPAGKTSIQALVEDDLILSVPGRVCDVQACANAPAMSYAAEKAAQKAGDDAGEDEQSESPLAVLAALKAALKKQREGP